MLGEEFRVAPRITFGGGHSIVGISPIAFTPIARHVADAGMRGGGGKEVGLGLEIHRHKATVRGAQATDAFSIHKRMGFTELFRSLDDLVSCPVPPSIDVAGGEFLPVTDGTAGIDDIDHIVARSEQLGTIGRSHAARGGRGAAIIIDDQRIFLLRIEGRRQTHHAFNHGAIGCRKVPRLHFAQFYLVQPFLHRIGQQSGLAFLAVVQIGHTGTGIASTHVGHQRGVVIGHREIADDILFQRQHLERCLPGVVTINVLAILVGSIEIDTAIGTIPRGIDNGRIEVTGDRGYLFGG